MGRNNSDNQAISLNIGAIVLAAGLGKRIQKISQGKPKFLVQVKSKPLLAYPLKILRRINIRDIVIVVPGGWLENAVNIVQDLKMHDITIVENNRFWRENGYSLYLGLKHLSKRNDMIVLSMVDHLYTSSLVLRVIETLLYKEDLMVVGGDSKALFVDHREATKIATTREGLVTSIGKELVNYDYIDVGVMAVKPDILDQLREIVDREEVLSLNKIINWLSASRNVRVADVTGCYWTEMDTVEDYYEVVSGKRNIVLMKILEELEGG